MAGIGHLLGHGHTHAGTQPGGHAGIGGLGRGGHGFGGGELRIFAQIPDNAHGGAFVHRLFDGGGEGNVLDIEFRHREAVFGQGGGDFRHDQLAQIGGIGGHVQNGNARA